MLFLAESVKITRQIHQIFVSLSVCTLTLVGANDGNYQFEVNILCVVNLAQILYELIIGLLYYCMLSSGANDVHELIKKTHQIVEFIEAWDLRPNVA